MWKVLWLFVLVATLPLESWLAMDDYQRWLLTQMVGATYCEQINKRCAEAVITVFGINDVVYLDAECTREKPQA